MASPLLKPCRPTKTPFLSTASRRPLVVRALADGSSLLQAGAAVALAASGGVAAWKFATYGQLEYITAAMLTNHVPKGDPGPRVIQIQGGSRELYYYPKSTVQVTVVGEQLNKGLLEQAGLQAAVPTLARPQSPANLGFAADCSVDAVVALPGGLAGLSGAQRAAFTGEALRVLKPGCPLVFVERIPGGLPIRFLGTSGKTLEESFLQGLKQRTEAFELVQWDVALEGQDPHALGVAIKAANYRVPVQASSKRAEKAAEKAERERTEREARREKARLPK
ncbi:hypothetical protein Agub_g11376, partial [Astrephomene gubernaculifera]